MFIPNNKFQQQQPMYKYKNKDLDFLNNNNKTSKLAQLQWD
jgi:hypothetical protein